MAPPALALRILCVRCSTTSSTFGAFGRRAPVLSLRLMHGPFPGISSDRLRPIPTKVRLNRLQGHQLKGRFWWFIGVYLQSREGVRMRILPKERKVPAPWRIGNVLPKYS